MEYYVDGSASITTLDSESKSHVYQNVWNPLEILNLVEMGKVSKNYIIENFCGGAGHWIQWFGWFLQR